MYLTSIIKGVVSVTYFIGVISSFFLNLFPRHHISSLHDPLFESSIKNSDIFCAIISNDPHCSSNSIHPLLIIQYDRFILGYSHLFHCLCENIQWRKCLGKWWSFVTYFLMVIKTCIHSDSLVQICLKSILGESWIAFGCVDNSNVCSRLNELCKLFRFN